MSKQLAELGFNNVTALDCNYNMLEEAKRKNVYRDFVHAKLGNVRVPIPDGKINSFSMATCSVESSEMKQQLTFSKVFLTAGLFLHNNFGLATKLVWNARFFPFKLVVGSTTP